MQNQVPRSLDEVSFIRPILIILLIIVHCFTVFNGGWPPFDNYQDCTAYKWLSRTCYSFLLETFVFISGYVWSYQKNDLGRANTLIQIILKKAKRLLLPSIVFSIIYQQLFNTEVTDYGNVVIFEGGGREILSVLSGVGHLWFLPVLFWCFIWLYLIEKIQINEPIRFEILLILSLLPYPYIPFQLSRVPYYLLFFYLGYKTRQYKGQCRFRLSLRSNIGLWLAFAVTFVALRMLKAHLSGITVTAPLIGKILYNIVSRGCQLSYSILGVFAIFCTALYFIQKHNLPQWYKDIGALCFGVYVYQEFIIKYLYYYTDLPYRISYLLLPWVAFVITLILSLLVAKVSKSL